MTEHVNIKQPLAALVIGIIAVCSFSDPCQAQFLDLRLDIDSKTTAQTEQNLDFGSFQTNSGRQGIDFGSTNMGIFSITALEKQTLLIRLDKPQFLIHDNPAVKEKIPLKLYSRYGYSPQNYRNSKPLMQSTQSIRVEPNPEAGPWNSLYLFIYGSVDIGNIPGGVYSNKIVLEVQYI